MLTVCGLTLLIVESEAPIQQKSFPPTTGIIAADFSLSKLIPQMEPFPRVITPTGIA
jgi:hypothetical protein